MRVLLDSYGAKLVEPELVSLMINRGVEVRWFRPLATWRFWRIDKRTHRKILICDNRIGFTGGVGIAQQWTGNARNENEWRDTHLKIEGAALIDLRAAFLDNWNEAGDWLFEEPPLAITEKQGDVPVQILRASSTTGWTDIACLIRTMVALSKKSIYVVTAYFVPDQVLMNLLIAARQRGVAIKFLLPGKQTDSRLSQLAGHQAVEDLLKADISIWLYQKTLLHAKIIIIDDCVVCIGSANLNHRSMGKDEECCAVCLSEPTAEHLIHQFEVDCRDSVKLNYDEWSRRNWLVKLQESVARFFSEQL